MILIMVIGVIIFLGILEFFLAGRRSKWPGLVLPVLSLALLIPLLISMASAFFPVPVWTDSIGDETLDDAKVYFGVVYDEQERIAAFSDLKVKDKKTGKVSWLPMEFDESGALIGGGEAMQYEESILLLEEDFPEIKGRKSSSPNQMRWQYVRYNHGGYRDAAVITFLYVLSVILYFIIYVWERKNYRKQEKRKREEKAQLLNQL